MTSHSDFLSNSISGESRVSSTEGVGVENRQSMEGASRQRRDDGMGYHIQDGQGQGQK